VISSVGVMLFGSGAMLLGIVKMWSPSTLVDGITLVALGLLVLDSGGRTLREVKS
jgi:hypothetical protein